MFKQFSKKVASVCSNDINNVWKTGQNTMKFGLDNNGPQDSPLDFGVFL